jgi:hypothetical protein
MPRDKHTKINELQYEKFRRCPKTNSRLSNPNSFGLRTFIMYVPRRVMLQQDKLVTVPAVSRMPVAVAWQKSSPAIATFIKHTT